ncbi:hypothetical protein F53441_6416 [Fusarium austroafricanum]|uniref:Cas1p 10 TM acyl transferase domain-containing protein n=1 Tax=Fusarium austroafricanum TaxID=2364996 RepID=A0A8H4KHC3_9HYPO|nr:hypothetical protein F53441_6416 [Fusarium austroafricanum]
MLIAGDSTSKNVALAMGHMLDAKSFENDTLAEIFPKMESFNMTYHGQMIHRATNVWVSAHGVAGQEEFVNHIETYVNEKTNPPTIEEQKGPALVYLSAGAWFTFNHLKTDVDSTVNHTWEDRFSTFKEHLSKFDDFVGNNTPSQDWYNAPMDSRDGRGNQIFFAPPAGPVYLGKNPGRVAFKSRQAREVVEMQKWLYDTEDQFNVPFVWSIPNLVIGQDKIWRDPHRTGFHVKFHVAELRANILLNMRCNAKLDRMKSYPYSRTCCTDYGVKPFSQLAVIALGILYLAACLICEFLDIRANRSTDQPRWKAFNMQAGAFVLALLMCYYADRTQMMAKGSKLWQLKDFVALCIPYVVILLATIRRTKPTASVDLSLEKSETDQPLLSREQTDEWKGWMQFFILIHNWTDAQGRSIHVFNRLCVAAYLFQTGYGHTLYFLQKNDFSFNRVAATLLRLNILSCCLAYYMDTDYMFYCFSPLVSFWFLVVYVTLAISKKHNRQTEAVMSKIWISCFLVSLIFMGTPCNRWIFAFLKTVFKIQWNYHTWQNHVTLDMFIVYVGMATAVVNLRMKFSSQLILRVILGVASLLAILHYFHDTSRLRMSTYIFWHPFISFVPVLAFVAMRNVSGPVRDYHSKAMAWLGRCSLETYILQFHILLAADGNGILIVDGLFGDGSLLGDRWRTLVIILPIFLWVSHTVAGSTGYIIKLILDQTPEDKKLGFCSFAWVERIPGCADIPGPKVRVACILLVMWLLNLIGPGHKIPAVPNGGHAVHLSPEVPREIPF